MKINQIAGAAGLLAMLTACAEPTISRPETRTPPTGAAFDGIGLGSGGFTESDPTEAAASTTGEDGATSSCTAEDGRGGVGLGSGGRTEDCPTDPQ